MKELSDTDIALAKHPGISYVTISELSMWVTDKDRAIARKAEENMREQVEELIIGGRLGEPEQKGRDVYFLDAKGWQELKKEK